MRLNNIYISAYIIFILSGCAADIKMPEVVEVSPQRISAENETSVKVVFSEEMKRSSAENAFLLSSSEGVLRGEFLWESGSRSFLFTPLDVLRSGIYYTAVISKNAEDISGNKIRTEFIYSFHTGADIIPPGVIYLYPENYITNFSRSGIITVKFSEKMNRQSVEKNLKIYPSSSVVFSWDDAQTVNIIPSAMYDFMTDYTVVIGKECADAAGNIMIKERKAVFTAGNEFIRPYISGITAFPQSEPDESGNLNWINGGNFSEWYGVEKNAVLNFRFSEPVDRQSFSEAIKITPAAEFTVTWDSDVSCSVNFLSGLQPEIKYELRIIETLKDLSGNEALDQVVLYFYANAAGDSIPQIIESDLISSDSSITADLNRNAVSEINNLPVNDGRCSIRFNFSQAMDLLSVHDNISIEKVTGVSSGGESVWEYEWDETGKILITKLVSVKEKNLYRITVRGGENGIKSSAETSMNEDIIFYFIINGDI